MSLLDEKLIGSSPAIEALRGTVGKLLAREAGGLRFPAILLQGETGTGKGVLAMAIHAAGPRRAGPFVDVNCAAIPDTLLEAELFGYERGAFTDARQAKQGLFQAANRGTLLLDEVGLLPDALQAKLLKVIEDRVVRRLGGIRGEPVDLWLIAATSEHLDAATRARRFREDLFHRLAVVTLVLPPLRERGRDILLLAGHFLARACTDHGLPRKALAADAERALLAYRWPGNVRELANVMERVALLAEEPVVTAAALGLPPQARPARAEPGMRLPLEEAVAGVERAHLVTTLEETGWNITRTAARLGVSRNTLRYRMRKYGLAADGARTGPPAPPPPAAADPAPTGRSPRDAVPAGASPPSTAPAAVVGGLRWERWHLALLRAVVGNPNGSRKDAHRTLDLLVGKVRSFGGRIETLGATGLLAAFGLEPIEDAPRRAAHAAVAAAKAAERAPHQAAGATPVRFALHVARAMVGRVEDRAEIEETERQRMAAVLDALVASAPAGGIVVSEDAVPFLSRRFALAPIEGRRGAAPAVYRLGAQEPSGLGRRLAPFVGRERELALLDARYREAAAGAVQAVDVVGDAGIGKSRLVHELGRRLTGEPVLLVAGHCTAFGGSSPFLPFIEIVRSIFLLEEDDDEAETDRKLERGLDLLGLPAGDAVPLLQLLLGLPPRDAALDALDGETIGARSHALLCDVLRERCRLSPVVLVVDDVHWADTASRECLRRIVTGRERLPLLVVCTARAPHRTDWAGLPDASELRLDPLPDEHCLHVARERLGTADLPDAVARLILEKAEGNPLFAEEIAGYLLEGGILHRRDGRLALAAGAPAARLPATLQELMIARVDRLDGELRALLEVASVIGRRFPADLLRAATPDGVARRLDELEALELVVREDPRVRDEYGFKHVLIQEAVYEALAPGRREALHEAVAGAIERIHEGRLGEWVEALALHYSRTSRADRAVRYLARAGEKSLRVYSLEEAERRFREVIGLLEAAAPGDDEPFLADAVLGWGQVLYYRNDYRALVALLARYRGRLEALGDSRRLSLFCFWLGFAYFLGARFDLAKPLLARARALGQAAADETCVAYACMGLMYAYWVAPGDGEDVERLGQRALEVARRVGDLYLASQCLLGLALFDLSRARYAEARALARELLDLGRARRAPRSVAMGLYVLAWAAIQEGRYGEAIDHAEEALRVAPDPADRLMARAARGAALALMGRAREGMEALRQVRAELVEGGYLVLLLGVDVPYGVATVLAGELASGVRWIEAALRRFTAWGTDFERGRAHAVLGDIHLRLLGRDAEVPLRLGLGNLGFVVLTRPLASRKAQRHFEDAARIARAVGIPTLLARSLVGLALVSRARGRDDQATAYAEEARRVAEPLGDVVLLERVRAVEAELSEARAGRPAGRGARPA